MSNLVTVPWRIVTWRNRRTGPNIFSGQLGKVPQDFVLGHTTCEIFQDILHGDAQSPDARFAATLARLDCYDLTVIHGILDTTRNGALQFFQRPPFMDDACTEHTRPAVDMSPATPDP